MFYQKIQPPKHLMPYVQCFYIWEYNSLAPLFVESPPTSFSSMVFNYGDYYNVKNVKYQSVKVPQAFLTGQATTSYSLTINGAIGMIGIVFQPAAMHTLFNLPLSELTDERLAISDLLKGDGIRILQDKVVEAHGNTERLRLLIDFLNIQLMKNAYRFDAVDFTVNQIVDAKGIINLSDMMSNLFMCRRQFERKFFQKVGLSPKFYARTRRLSHICSLMAGKRQVNWQHLLYDCGYYDQAHFIKDFTTFLGRTPTEYLKTNVELTHFLNQGQI